MGKKYGQNTIWPNSPYAYLRNHEGYGATSNRNFYLLTEYIKKYFRSRTGENFSAMSPGHWAHLRLFEKVSLKKPSWPSGEDCRLVEIDLKFDSQQNPKDFALDKK